MSQGTAPWTVTVAFLNHVPYTYRFPANYAAPGAKTWVYNYTVPSFRGGAAPQLIVGVTDASGKRAATSRFLSVGGAAGGSCAVAEEKLDFVWSTRPATQRPASCDDLQLAWSTERGQPGPTGPVVLTVLPENDVPQSFSTNDARSPGGGYTWTNGLDPGTDFALLVTDAGPSRNAGVGGRYTSGGKARQCSTRRNAGVLSGSQLLPAPGTTLAAGAGGSGGGGAAPSSSPSASSSASRTSTRGASGSSAKPTKTGGASSSSSQQDTSGSGDSGASSGKTGAAVGGAIGGIAAIALLGVGIWYWRRKAAAAHAGAYGFGSSGVGAGKMSNSSSSGSGSGAGFFGFFNARRRRRGANLPRDQSQFDRSAASWGNGPPTSISLGMGGWAQHQQQQLPPMQHGAGNGMPPLHRTFSNDEKAGSVGTHDSHFDDAPGAPYYAANGTGFATTTTMGAIGAGRIRMAAPSSSSSSPPRAGAGAGAGAGSRGQPLSGDNDGSFDDHTRALPSRASAQLGSSPQHQRGIFSTVPDDHLFPPPRPKQQQEQEQGQGQAARPQRLNSASSSSSVPRSGSVPSPTSPTRADAAPVLTTAQLARKAAPSAQWAPAPPYGVVMQQQQQQHYTDSKPLPPVSSERLYQAAGLSSTAGPGAMRSSSSMTTQQLQQLQAQLQQQQHQQQQQYAYGRSPPDGAPRQLSPIPDELGESRPASWASEHEQAEVIDLRGQYPNPHQQQQQQQRRTSAFASQVQADSRRVSQQMMLHQQQQLQQQQQQQAQRNQPAAVGSGRMPGSTTRARHSHRQSIASDSSGGTYLAYLDE